MQILLLGLFVALYLHDSATMTAVRGADGTIRYVEALPQDCWPYLGPLPVLMIVLGPKLLLALIYQTACMRTRRKLGQSGGQRAITRLETFTAALPILLLLLFLADLWLGALRVVRLTFQHTVLIDELIVLLPTLAVATLAWWSYYPIDRRLREAMIFRLADEGQPVYPLLTRGQYVSMQLRHQFGLLLVPLLAIYAWSQSLVLLGPDHRQLLSAQAALALTPIGVLLVFILSPLVIRHIWHTAALPQGEVRERMLGLCRQHRVKVRELLLWRTGGGLVNAAVTGLIAPVRYILLSDGLLDQATPKQVEAVMAHELAHVKCKHIVWMGLVLIATLGVTERAANRVYTGLHHALAWEQLAMHNDVKLAGINLTDPQNQMLIAGIPAFAITVLVFGWVSRRIERQADVFAVRHLAMTRPDPVFNEQAHQVFDAESAETMVDALQRVADLNHAPVQRKSWRHGSIAWRQAHLRSLVGTPIHAAAVDRTLFNVKLATLIGFAGLLATYFL